MPRRALAVVSVLAVLVSAQPTVASDSGAFEAAVADPSMRAQMVESDINYRAALHLRQDRAFVETLYADLSGTVRQRDAGALFTPLEFAEVITRQSLEDDVIAIDQSLHDEDSYAGTFIDHHAGGVVVVLVVGQGTSHAVPETRHGDRVVIRTADNTLAALEAAYLQVSEAFMSRDPAARDILEVALDVPGNQVRVGYRADSRAATDIAEGRVPRTFEDAFDAAVVSFEVVQTSEQFRTMNLDCDTSVPPIWGGHGYSDISHGSCTTNFESFCSAGFEMDKAGDPDTDYVLTAAHCFEVPGFNQGDPVFHRNVQLGFRGTRELEPRDAGLIRMPNQSYVTDDVEHALNRRDVAGVTLQYPEGVLRCATGIVSTASVCGDILNSAVSYVCFDPVTGQQYNFANQVEVDVVIQSGDSGGPMYRYITEQAVAYAAGINSCTNGMTSRFQKITDLPTSWAVTVSLN